MNTNFEDGASKATTGLHAARLNQTGITISNMMHDTSGTANIDQEVPSGTTASLTNMTNTDVYSTDVMSEATTVQRQILENSLSSSRPDSTADVRIRGMLPGNYSDTNNIESVLVPQSSVSTNTHRSFGNIIDQSSSSAISGQSGNSTDVNSAARRNAYRLHGGLEPASIPGPERVLHSQIFDESQMEVESDKEDKENNAQGTSPLPQGAVRY